MERADLLREGFKGKAYSSQQQDHEIRGKKNGKNYRKGTFALNKEDKGLSSVP